MKEIRINYINISGEEFSDKLLENSECGKSLCYSAATEKDALLPFPEAIENISREPCRTYIEVKVSSEMGGGGTVANNEIRCKGGYFVDLDDFNIDGALGIKGVYSLFYHFFNHFQGFLSIYY